MSEMIRINETALEHVTGGTHQEMMDLKKAFGVQGNGAGSRIDELEDMLYTKHRIDGCLSDFDFVDSIYRHADTGEFLTHAQVMSMIG